MNEKNRSFLLAKKEERMGEEKKLNIRIGQVKDVNNRQVFSKYMIAEYLSVIYILDLSDTDV